VTFIVDLWILIDFCSFLSLIYCLLTRLTKPIVGLFVAYGYTQIISRLITHHWEAPGFFSFEGCPENPGYVSGDMLEDRDQITFLVGGFNPSEKYWSAGIIIPNIRKK
jgi:hypothetical protein